ncbi:uncharacterized protein LOC105849541 [Hydra vulgaris]|uniref:uncharacterized protein LOC105849541 n=1 Tax=Hydra vulgaris TaxID=6087 RepID=UPI001F5F7AF8|nr:uncharacterized protein LOC105849541 [Hydra vulgaris]
MDQSILKFLFLFALNKNDVELYITRLPCIFYASFTLTPNKYIEGNITATFIVSSINDCGTYCVRSPTCEFANFNANEKICQIISSSGNLTKSITNQQWQVLLTDRSSNENVGPICENNTPCNNMYCRDTCLALNGELVHSYFCSDENKVSKYAIPSDSTSFSIHVPQNLIDSDYATICDAFSNDGTEAWIKLDLKKIFQITYVVIYADDRTNDTLSRLSGCKVQSSINDTEYQTFAILKGLAIEQFSWNGCLQYFRIIQRFTHAGLSFREINIWS